MSCHIGRVVIVKNEGTVIFGNVRNNSPSSASNDDGGSTESDTDEVSVDDIRFSASIPISPNVPDVTMSKSQTKNKQRSTVRGTNVKSGHRREGDIRKKKPRLLLHRGFERYLLVASS